MKQKLLAIGSHLRRKSIVLAALVILLICSGLWYWHVRAVGQFLGAYASYAQSASAQQTAAYTPGSPNNPLRQSLNAALVELLAPDTTPARRLALAQSGLSMLNSSTKEVDAMHDLEPPVDEEVSRMKAAAESIATYPGRSLMLDIVAQAQAQLSTIEDIRGLSYRANFETQQIFNRIIADKGVLTANYAQDLNNEIPQVETQFDKRSDDYLDLQKSINRIEAEYEQLSGAAKPEE